MNKQIGNVEVLVDRIEVENFKGLKKEDYSFDGDNVLISGKNKSGKSTIYEAYLWCLFQKCASGTADNVQPRQNAEDGELGEVIHKLKTSVFVTLIVNGEKQVFGRTLEENWSKPRGKDEELLSGTTSEYYFNSKEVPCGLTTFKKHLNEIYNIDIWYVCSNIDNFIRMKVNERRDLLKSVSECKSDVEIAERYPLVKRAFEEKKNIDEFKKEVSQSLTKARNEYDSIPEQKNAQEKLRVTIDEESLNKEREEVEQSIKNIDDILQQNANSEVFKQVQEKQKLLLQLQSYLQRRQDEIKKDYDKRKANINSKIKDLQEEIDGKFGRIKPYKDEIDYNKHLIMVFEKNIKEIGNKWDEENQRQIEVPDTCDKCGSVLTDEIRQKYLDSATKEKKGALQRMEQEATEYDTKIRESQNIIDNANKSIEKLNKEINTLNEQVKQSDEQIKGLPDIVSLCAEDEECTKLSNSLMKTNDELDQLKKQISTDNDIKVEELKIEKSNKQQRLADILRELAKVDVNKHIDIEQQNLDNHAKELIKDMDVLEQKMKQINDFKKERINYIEKSVSSLFNLCQFKMFEKNLTNDGEKDICTPYCNGVPIEEQNLATKIAMKIDICNGLMRAIECKFPLFIDNSESISPLPQIDCQRVVLKHIPDQSLFINKISN